MTDATEPLTIPHPLQAMSRATMFDRLPPALRPQTDVPVGILEWRSIARYPDYEISSFGLVRRAYGMGSQRIGRILRPSLSDGIYPTVELYSDGVGRTERVHLLLASAFIRAARPGEVVRHLDGRPQLPTAWTVGYGDVAANAQDRRLHAMASAAADPGEDVIVAACATLDMRLLGATMRQACAQWGVSASKAAKLRLGRRHSAALRLVHLALARMTAISVGANAPLGATAHEPGAGSARRGRPAAARAGRATVEASARPFGANQKRTCPAATVRGRS